MRWIAVALVFLVVLASSASAFVTIEHWSVPEQAYAADSIETSTQLDFDTFANGNTVKTVFVIPELDVRASQGPFLPHESRHTRIIRTLKLPDDAAPGEYVVRMTIIDKEGNRRVKHRFVEIE